MAAGRADISDSGGTTKFEEGDLSRMRTIALLTISNIFMTFAWYGHLKFREVPLFKVVIVELLTAFFEYCFQAPPRIALAQYEFVMTQVTIQEIITLTVFAVFSVLYLKQPMRWNYLRASP